MVYPVNYFNAAMEGAQAVQNQYEQRQKFQQQLLQFQQEQLDRQREQAAQAAAGNALPQLFQGGMPAQGPQMPPPPQPPAPGQASQPMQQAGGGVPLPQGPVPGQALRPPLPPGGVQGSMPPPGVPPFRPMPTTPPQSAAPQGEIPAPPTPQPQQQPAPQGGLFTLESAVKALQGQGLQGADLMAGLGQMMPLLDAQAKQQAAQLQTQFNNELKLQTLQDRHDAWKQASEDRKASVEERRYAAEQANATRAMLGQLSISIRQQALAQKLQGNPDAKLAPEDLKFMAQQYLAAPDPSIFTNLGRGAQGAANVVGLRKAIKAEASAQGMSPSDVAAAGIGVQGEKAFARAAGTRTAAIETAAAEFQQVAPIVRQASADLPRTQAIPINEVMQAAQTGTGDPRWVKLGQAIDTATNVYARAISPTGVPTEGSRQQARSHFKASMTPEQIEAVLGVMDQEVAAARRAPAEVKASQKARLAGKKAEDSSSTIPQGWSVTEH